MKLISLLLYAAAIGFCVVSLLGHSGAWAAAALLFFAGSMVLIGQRKKPDRND